MDQPDGKLRIAALGDLHVHDAPPHPYQALFRQIATRADVLVLCGDLTHFGAEAEARTLAEDLQELAIPAVGVLGNHDCEGGRATEVKQILRDRIHFLEDEPYEIRGVSFAGVKGFGGGFGAHMLSAFGEDTIKSFVAEAVRESMRLEKVLQGIATERTIVVLHYAPIVGTIEGESPALFPFLGCSRLAEVIDRFPVSAVFHGHAHHGSPEGRTLRGVPVFNCSEALLRRLTPEKPYALFELEAA